MDQKFILIILLIKHFEIPERDIANNSVKEAVGNICFLKGQPACAGIITWCHTFSPSKMWINGFVDLQKPYCLSLIHI